MRLSRLALLVLVFLGLSLGACGGSDSDAPESPNDPAAPKKASVTLQELRACVDEDPDDRIKAVLTEGKPAAAKFSSEELDAYVPNAVLDRALGAGGYMRIRYDRKDPSNPIQVGSMDVLALRTSDAAKAAAETTLRGKDSDGASISEEYNVIQADALLLVYPNRYREDRGGGAANRGVRGSAQRCLEEIGSPVKLPAPESEG